jgi:hypothetical protein
MIGDFSTDEHSSNESAGTIQVIVTRLTISRDGAEVPFSSSVSDFDGGGPVTAVRGSGGWSEEDRPHSLGGYLPPTRRQDFRGLVDGSRWLLREWFGKLGRVCGRGAANSATKHASKLRRQRRVGARPDFAEGRAAKAGNAGSTGTRARSRTAKCAGAAAPAGPSGPASFPISSLSGGPPDSSAGDFGPGAGRSGDHWENRTG